MVGEVTDQREAGTTDTDLRQDPTDAAVTALQDVVGMVRRKVDEADMGLHHEAMDPACEEAGARHRGIKARTTAEAHPPERHTKVKVKANTKDNSLRVRLLVLVT